MRVGEACDCLFCLAPRGAGLMLRLDRKQRPYFRCESCGTMVFLRGGTQSLRGPSLLWGPMNRAMQSSDADAAKVLLDRAVKENPTKSAKEIFDDAQ